MTALVRPWWVSKKAPDRVRDGVHAAEALLECGGAHAGRRQHARAGLDVAAVGAGARQVLADQAHALEGDAVGEGVKARRAVGLEAVGKGVHAGRGGEAGRQAHGQLRVGNDDGGHHLRVEDDLLLVRGLVAGSRPARPTSEPVPAVVGTAITGRDAGGSARVHQSPISSKSRSGRVRPDMKAMTLPASSAEPPPKAMTPSWLPAR